MIDNLVEHHFLIYKDEKENQLSTREFSQIKDVI